MINKNIRKNIYEMFYKDPDVPLIDFLNSSSCDEILEIDFNNDSFKGIYHVEGKYFMPIVQSSFRQLYDFVSKHIVHPKDLEAYTNLMNPDGFLDRLKNNKPIPNFAFGQFRYKLQAGDYRYVEQAVITGKENGLADGIVRLYVFDIHNFKKRQLGQVSNDSKVISTKRDRLTGLLNQAAFIEQADKMVRRKKDVDWCIIAIDIEHFNLFDEWYGRETGDYLLSKIGVILFDNEKKLHGVAGYFGQDDFVFVMPFDNLSIHKLYSKIRDAIATYGSSVGFNPAFGIAHIEKDMEIVDAFDRATIASTKAKKDIKQRIYTYDPEMQAATENEYRILTEFMNALKNDELTFYLQPQCRISTGKIVGAEALARWIKPDGTIIPPGEFVPILEKYGFITDLDTIIWEKVCKSLSDWISKGQKAVPVSINVSRTDIFNIDFHKHLLDLTKKYNIPHDLIKVEITESAYTETTTLIGQLVKDLRADGFSVLMDDFGSGYSSLNMLGNLKVDAIKLDANFLHIEGADYEKSIHILESVVNMAKLIAIPIIVEGVETQSQSDFLEDLGCRYVQGFHFYRPMSVDEFGKVASDPNNLDERGFVVKLNEQFRIREFLDQNIYSDTMLNNIIGAVAFYSWHDGTHVDIVRFNQQFYESVGVPDFHQRLVNIEQFLPEEDRPIIVEALRKAMKERLTGASALLRFYKTDGYLSCYNIHFYYLGRKEGGERFYGSAVKISELADLKDEKKLIAKFSSENMIFVKKISDKWVYSVVSHGLADAFNLTTEELEKELNNGDFAKRVEDREALAAFMKEVASLTDHNQNFTKTFMVRDKHNELIKLDLHFVCVKELTNNIKYILFANLVKE